MWIKLNAEIMSKLHLKVHITRKLHTPSSAMLSIAMTQTKLSKNGFG